MINVLFVDDEQSLLDLGKIFLEEGGGCVVDCVLSGNDAIRVMAEKKYDAVVSDYQMPGNGRDHPPEEGSGGQ